MIPVIIFIFRKDFCCIKIFSLAFFCTLLPLFFYQSEVWGNWWKTGYFFSEESTAFSIYSLVKHTQLYLHGLVYFGIGPLLLFGIVLPFLPIRKKSQLILLIFAPTFLVCVSYYFTSGTIPFSYLRFILLGVPLAYILLFIAVKHLLLNKKEMISLLLPIFLFFHIFWFIYVFHLQAKQIKNVDMQRLKIVNFAKKNISKNTSLIAQYDLLEELDFCCRWKLYSDLSINKGELRNYLLLAPKNGALWLKNSSLAEPLKTYGKLTNSEWTKKYLNAVTVSGNGAFMILANRDFAEKIVETIDKQKNYRTKIVSSTTVNDVEYLIVSVIEISDRSGI